MFASVGHRLAVLNAAVVIVIVAVIGSVTFFALRQQLNAEVDSSLHSQLETVADQWVRGQLAAPAPSGTSTPSHESEDEDVLRSGDTIVLVVDRSGQVVYNPRGIAFRGFPVQDGIARALAGHRDVRSLAVSDVGTVRVMTVPVRDQQGIAGAAQAIRGLQEHQRELSLLQWLMLAGLGLGALIAIPAGLFLARRAMRPIHAAFNRQRAFVADASHELRTPLTLIRANTELVLGEPQARVAEVEPELNRVLAEVDRTDRLVDDLLTLARADAGRLPLQREPHDLRAIAATAVSSMSALAAARGLTLEIEPIGPSPIPTPCPVLVDGERMLQTIRILIDNAIKHTAAGGAVRLSVSCSRKEAGLRVSDTGEGIPPAELERVFDRFYRVDKARSRAGGGTGLGLAIARALVEAHGGQITLESRLGVGTTVEVRLPLRAVQAASPNSG